MCGGARAARLGRVSAQDATPSCSRRCRLGSAGTGHRRTAGLPADQHRVSGPQRQVYAFWLPPHCGTRLQDRQGGRQSQSRIITHVFVCKADQSGSQRPNSQHNLPQAVDPAGYLAPWD